MKEARYVQRSVFASRRILLWVVAAAIVLLPYARQAEAQEAESVFAVTSSNRLIQFSSADPDSLTAQHPISGLQANESVLGIDFRPANGQLVALGSTNRLYTLDTTSGAATPIGTQPFTTTVLGSAVGFVFNPTVDRIRLVTDTRNDLRLNPNNGTVAAVDGALAYSVGDPNQAETPVVVAAGYTNNISPTVTGATTQLYVIDSNLNILAKQGGVGTPPASPNTGQLFTVGTLGVDASTLVGFDIAPSGTALTAITTSTGTTSNLGSINLTTGAVTNLGRIGGSETIRSIAVPTLPLSAPATPDGQTLFAVTSENRLVQFNSANPGTLTAQHAITGLQPSEAVLGIDFRPANGQLLAVSSTNRLYTIDPANGAATLIGTQPFTTTVLGNAVGFDFNPTVDRIRFISDTRNDLRLNPNNGAVAGVDGRITYAISDTNSIATPNVVGAAYTNNFSGTTSTTLYVIDSSLNTLAIQGSAGLGISPNSGQLFTVGALDVDTSELVGFDITPTGTAFVATTASGGTSSTLGTIDLATGKVTSIGAIGGETIRGLAAPANTTPALVYRAYLPILIK